MVTHLNPAAITRASTTYFRHALGSARRLASAYIWHALGARLNSAADSQPRTRPSRHTERERTKLTEPGNHTRQTRRPVRSCHHGIHAQANHG